jgi:hypothetical protein
MPWPGGGSKPAARKNAGEDGAGAEVSGTVRIETFTCGGSLRERSAWASSGDREWQQSTIRSSAAPASWQGIVAAEGMASAVVSGQHGLDAIVCIPAAIAQVWITSGAAIPATKRAATARQRAL